MRRTRGRRALTVVLVGLMVSGACSAADPSPWQPIADRRPANGNVVVDWNVVALRAAAAAPFDPPRESRALAMVHGAVFDAVNSITGGYAPYLTGSDGPRDGSAAAAVAAAARDVLVAVYPPQHAALDDSYRTSLATVPDGPSKDAGIAAGQEAAARMIAHRSGDHADASPTYAPSPAVGIWLPTPPAFVPALGPGWGSVTPFTLRRPSQFRPPAPYRLSSRAYARDFEEVKAVGSATSAVRTADQTTVARFWSSTAPQEWNQFVAQLAGAKRLSVVDTARLYAQLNFAEADAAIAAWDTKFHYGQWRPISGIRGAAEDGNRRTVVDPQWAPLLPTPPFPDYVCGHSTLAAAAQAVFEHWFGRKPGVELTLTSAATPGVARRYPTFRSIADEVTNARVWAGAHWRTSCTAGASVGRSVGRFVAGATLRRVRSR